MIRTLISFLRARFKKSILEEIWLKDYIRMGMKVGDHCSIQPGVIFDYSHCWLIEIGHHVTIAPHAYLLAHDASTKPLVGYTRIAPIVIQDHVFIGARALIMPGVIVGRNSIVAAGSVVTKSVPEGSIVAGNPARVIGTVESYTAKSKQLLEASATFDGSYTIRGRITEQMKQRMREELAEAVGFVE